MSSNSSSSKQTSSFASSLAAPASFARLPFMAFAAQQQEDTDDKPAAAESEVTHDIQRNKVTLTSDSSSSEHVRCQQTSSHIIQTNKNVQHLLDSMLKSNCRLPTPFFACRKCTKVSGGYISGKYAPHRTTDESSSSGDGDAESSTSPMPVPASQSEVPPGPAVVLCEDKMYTEREYTNVMMHELVHAFDDCRANVDLTNCLHHACTEIRASRLSGECTFTQEFRRMNVNPLGQYEECVRRRAILSLRGNANCSEKAEEAVAQVWQVCYNDSEPFTKRPI